MKVSIWQKDMAIIGSFATALGVQTPLFSRYHSHLRARDGDRPCEPRHRSGLRSAGAHGDGGGGERLTQSFPSECPVLPFRNYGQ